MAQELYANDASTTVAAAAGAPAGGTPETWVVASSASFPSASNVASPPTQFHVADPAAPSELILVTNVSGTTWSVTRGAESTIPVPHSAGYAIAQVLTAGDLIALATYTGDLSLVSGVTEVTSTHLAAPLPVTQGGIGSASLASYGVLAGGTASTTAVQQIAAGTAGQVLTGNGAGTLPSFQANVGFSSPMSALGDMIYGAAAGAPSRLIGGTVATKQFLVQTGTGSISAAPAWGTIASTDLPGGTTSAQGALQLDGTATDIQPLGTQSAGSGTLAAISTHVHPSSSLNPAATDQGFKAWTNDPISALSAVSPTAGVLYLARIAVQSVITVGTVSTFALGAASGATSQAATFVSLFNASGTTRYGVSSDISGSFSSTGLVSASVSGGTLTPGYYYAAFLMGTAATTASKLSAFAGGVSVPGYPSLNLTAATARWASQGAGLVAMPGTVNMASNSLTMSSLNTYFWFAIS